MQGLMSGKQQATRSPRRMARRRFPHFGTGGSPTSLCLTRQSWARTSRWWRRTLFTTGAPAASRSPSPGVIKPAARTRSFIP
ncbi:unnamed protein product [Symbiodinium natans]|uniref:Uncharacterized protein n=1 Tax=Symbiodinium natans TaxID=878477 RepID=A0A812VC27_9DINO|nr:unnamed protein product [Symbiodinium natans]